MTTGEGKPDTRAFGRFDFRLQHSNCATRMPRLVVVKLVADRSLHLSARPTYTFHGMSSHPISPLFGSELTMQLLKALTAASKLFLRIFAPSFISALNIAS